jgi:hypothetical protein
MVQAGLNGSLSGTKNLEDAMVRAIETQGSRIERIEEAIHGLHRLLVANRENPKP